MTRINLDDIESEATGEPHIVEYKGHEFVLPPEILFEACDAVLELVEAVEDEESPKAAVAAYKAGCALLVSVLGDEQYETFRQLRPSMQKAVQFASEIVKLYGFSGPGESEASVDSSPTTSSRSRPTSNASTRSTSERAATRNASVSVA